MIRTGYFTPGTFDIRMVQVHSWLIGVDSISIILYLFAFDRLRFFAPLLDQTVQLDLM